MGSSSGSVWDGFVTELRTLDAGVRKSRAVNINSTALRDQARSTVQHYFRRTRPDLVSLHIENDLIEQLDSHCHTLIRLAGGRNARSSYQKVVRSMKKLVPEIEAARELRIGSRGTEPVTVELSTTERAILGTLEQMIPSAAFSYRQAINDLADDDRISNRGTAVEMREALREVLDHLAPDKEVMKSEGFKLEKNRSGPTMSQKVKFILSSRGLSRNAIATPNAAMARIDDSAGLLARSVYTRSSISTHVSTSRAEVKQLKMYVDSVLAELLQIHG